MGQVTAVGTPVCGVPVEASVDSTSESFYPGVEELSICTQLLVSSGCSLKEPGHYFSAPEEKQGGLASRGAPEESSQCAGTNTSSLCVTKTKRRTNSSPGLCRKEAEGLPEPRAGP